MTATRFALIAAAIAVVALVAIKFIPAGGGFGLQPAPTPSPSPTPAATPMSFIVTGSGPVQAPPGTYMVGDPFLVPLRITIPAGWSGNIGGPYAAFLQKTNANSNVSFSVQQSLYADGCNFGAGFLTPTPGPSVDDFVSALASVRGFTTTAPVDVSIGGHSGRQVIVNTRATTSGCHLPSDDPNQFRLWRLPLGGTEDLSTNYSDNLRILDVNGQRLVIQSGEWVGETDAQKAEVQGILDSITIP